jgi:catechol 2,3-dioxygenase-like lactoylglutathione lyase family enzyme
MEDLMIAHVGILVSDIEKSKKFYIEALKLIGYQMVREYGVTPTRPAASAGFGEPPRPDLWIYQGTPSKTAVHIAFRVNTRMLVDAFYQAAIAAGGKDNGKPGIRPQYNPNYYGAFVFDPDGNNIEAVCREPQT